MRKEKIAIVGAGPAGIFAALAFVMSKVSAFEITIFEQGNGVDRRHCPKEIFGTCQMCPVCNVMCGTGGGGAGSDGKLVLPAEILRCGGKLIKIIGAEKMRMLLDMAYKCYMDFAAQTGTVPKVYGLKTTPYIRNLEKKAIANSLKLDHPPICHLGTEGAKQIYALMEQFLIENNVKFEFRTKVEDIIVEDGVAKGIVYTKKGITRTFEADQVLIAPGRVGAKWLHELFERHKIENSYSDLVIGVRAELPNKVLERINREMYEGKFRMDFNESPDVNAAKTFCQCPGGLIANENYGKILGDNPSITVNGHSYYLTKSDNTNESLLIDIPSNSSFVTNPATFIWELINKANTQGNGLPIVQRYEDFKNRRPTTIEKLKNNSFASTDAKAIPGDLTKVFPVEVCVALETFIEAINRTVPGFTVNGDLLLHGIEAKPVSLTPEINSHMETMQIKNLFVCGDGVNSSHGLLPASASGMYAALAMIHTLIVQNELINCFDKLAAQNLLNKFNLF